MRSVLLALASLVTVIGSSPAWSALPSWTPGGTLSFVQGSEDNNVTLVFPAVSLLDSVTLDVSYLDAAFKPLGPTSFSSGLFIFDSVSVTAPLDIGNGYRKVTALMFAPGGNIGGMDVPDNTLLLTMTLKVKSGLNPAPPGPTTIFTDLEYSSSMTAINSEVIPNPQPFIQATIVAVPEPETWWMMLAGLALVGAAAARAQRRT